VVKSPGISPYRGVAAEALAAGVRFTSGTALWFAARPDARVIAVTGTKGKSTTTALVAHLLRAGGQRVALAGNIGLPLLDLAGDEHRADWWVVELSSFQTRDMDAVPEIAVLLNLHPEHLDWHGSVEAYFADKLALFGRDGRRPRVAVLNAAQPLPEAMRPDADVRWFGHATGYHVRDGAIHFGERPVFALADLPLPGAHNALNACAALTAVAATGVNASQLAPHLATFRPLPHRLQSLGVRDSLEYVNDSIATTPHATIAALAHHAARNTTVLVGGFDRGVDWQPFADHVAAHPPHAIVTMGQNGERIAALLRNRPGVAVARAGSLADAMQRARELTPPGGIVLLSPGAPSFGEFRDYVERGRRFAALAGFDPERIATIEGLGIA
jgi:UDP-N-acetylmuramoylalanine--D-glutamate ligase